MRRLLVIALALLIAGPATAQAKLRALPGRGETPTVQVDGAGTAVVAWYQQQSTGEAIALCRIPKGRQKCPAVQLLDTTPGATSGAQPPLLRISGPDVDLVAARQQVILMHSADGGATFGPQVPIAEHVTYFAGAIGADGTVVLAFGPDMAGTNLAGPPSQETVRLLPARFASEEAVGFANGRPVYVSGARAPHTALRTWTGTGNIMDPATWTKRRSGPAMVYYALDHGPRGLWLVHELRVTDGDVAAVRRFRHGHFGPARTVPGSLGNIVSTTIAQDAKGRFAVAWYDTRSHAVRISASRTGRHWTRAKTIGHMPNFPERMSLGLGPDGRGLLVTDQHLSTRRVLTARINVRKLLR
jgi:hypothetical protein